MNYKVLKTLMFLFLLFFSINIFSQIKQRKWELVWSDNFDLKANIDTSVWSKIPRGTSAWKRYMSDFDSCYALRNGNLILRGIVNHTQKNDTAPYLTGGVYTKGRNLFCGGRIEVRAKIIGAQGAWPAIWMVAENADWPLGGEIDIMEHLNHDSNVYQTVHSYYTYNLKITKPPHAFTQEIIPNEYNVFAVEITPDSLFFYVNDELNFVYPRIRTNKKGQFPFYQHYYLLLDMQLGGSWAGEVNPNELPAEMWIDWVKYYQKK